MKKSNFALRLQLSLMKEAKKVAQAEGVAMNQLINVAVAEKCQRCARRSTLLSVPPKSNIKKALQLLRRAGTGNQPMPGDELPTTAPPRRRATRRRRG
jgi:hypothetical protein